MLKPSLDNTHMKSVPSELTDAVIEALQIKTDLGKVAVSVALNNLIVLDTKQQDYGRTNLDEFGAHGVLVRLNDKISRLKNLSAPGSSHNHEAKLDTWLDAANYGLIGAILEFEAKTPARETSAPEEADPICEDCGRPKSEHVHDLYNSIDGKDDMPPAVLLALLGALASFRKAPKSEQAPE